MLKKYNRNYKKEWQKTPAKLLLIFIIRIYQLTLSSFLGNQCRFQPTCSEYAYEAIARFGVIKGGYLSIIRIFKCRPGAKFGYDPVPNLVLNKDKT